MVMSCSGQRESLACNWEALAIVGKELLVEDVEGEYPRPSKLTFWLKLRQWMSCKRIRFDNTIITLM